MALPKLDLSILPDLDGAPGMYGTSSGASALSIDDRIVIIMVYVYEVAPPPKQPK